MAALQTEHEILELSWFRSKHLWQKAQEKHSVFFPCADPCIGGKDISDSVVYSHFLQHFLITSGCAWAACFHQEEGAAFWGPPAPPPISQLFLTLFVNEAMEGGEGGMAGWGALAWSSMTNPATKQRHTSPTVMQWLVVAIIQMMFDLCRCGSSSGQATAGLCVKSCDLCSVGVGITHLIFSQTC